MFAMQDLELDIEVRNTHEQEHRIALYEATGRTTAQKETRVSIEERRIEVPQRIASPCHLDEPLGWRGRRPVRAPRAGSRCAHEGITGKGSPPLSDSAAGSLYLT